jgi:hypothetical protein
VARRKRASLSDWGFIQRSAHAGFPAGTLVVNILGCFLIGVLAQHYLNVQAHPNMRAALMTGSAVDLRRSPRSASKRLGCSVAANTEDRGISGA